VNARDAGALLGRGDEDSEGERENLLALERTLDERGISSLGDLGLAPGESRHPLYPLTFPVQPEQPPSAPQELMGWAEERGLSTALSGSASELQCWLPYRLPGPMLGQLTLRQCLLGKSSGGLPKGFPGPLSLEVAEAARRHVRYVAHRRRLEEIRRTTWAKPPRPALSTLARALRGFHDRVAQSSECQGPVLYGEAGLAIGDNPPQAAALFDGERAHHRACIVFAGHEDGRLSGGCSCGQKPFCSHQRVLLEALLDAIHDDTGLAALLDGVVAVPSWQRLLGASANVPRASDEKPRERLC
jgi:hypothetical protein